MKKVKVIIGKDGTTKIDAIGYEDNSCLMVTGKLTKALGGKVIEEEKKPEAYNEATTEQHQKLGGGG